MADHAKQRERMWLSALREIGQHFSKIGDIIIKCAEDTENLTTRAYPKSTERGREELRLHKRKSTDDSRSAAYKPAETPARYPPPSEGRAGPSSAYRSRYAAKDTRDIQKPISRNGRVPMQAADDDNDEDDEMLSERFRGRKRAAASERLSFEDRHRRDTAQYPVSRRPSRPMKRVRMNWTDAENITFFDAIRRFATEDDNGVLQKIVAALGGSRTLIQCKGHFRNMLVVGKVVQSDTEPRRWIVVDEPPEQKRASHGGKSLPADTKNTRSSGVSKDDPSTGNRGRDDGDDERIKGSRSDDRGQSSHGEKPIDDEDDVVLEDIEDDDERDKDYQDEEGMDDEEEENESGTNNTAVRVTDVGDMDPGGAGAEYGNPSMGSSVRNLDDGAGKQSSMPLKKQPGGRVGEVGVLHSLHDKKDLH